MNVVGPKPPVTLRSETFHRHTETPAEQTSSVSHNKHHASMLNLETVQFRFQLILNQIRIL